MTITVLHGYQTVPGAQCPYCGSNHMACLDEGHAESVTFKCWCGATAQCRRDDPEIAALLTARAAEPIETPAPKREEAL